MTPARWTDLVFVRDDVDAVEEAAIQARAREAKWWAAAALALLLGWGTGVGGLSASRTVAVEMVEVAR
jgi:hypothetical protein